MNKKGPPNKGKANGKQGRGKDQGKLELWFGLTKIAEGGPSDILAKARAMTIRNGQLISHFRVRDKSGGVMRQQFIAAAKAMKPGLTALAYIKG